MKVLLVEDNPVNLELFQDLIELEGYEVLSANTGHEAIEIAKREVPDIILMDIQLPEMDGWEATKILKKTPETREIPIIALTAHAMEGDREKALDLGCDSYISKPINTRTFISDIKKVLSSSPVFNKD
jgi:CheY-like chemotaxis protein